MDAADAKRRGASGPQRIVTGSDGTFMFSNLLPGKYQIVARHAGYLIAVYGRRRHDDVGRHVTLYPGEDLRGLIVRAWKLAAIAGRVTDELDQPAVDVEVVSLRRTAAGGRIRYEATNFTRTDDDGRFRIANLRPGEYVVAVPSTVVTIPASVAATHADADERTQAALAEEASRSGAPVPSGNEPRLGRHLVEWLGMVGQISTVEGRARISVYPTRFYADAGRASAATVLQVESGGAMTGIDFRLNVVDAVSISGRLLGPGGPQKRTGLRLIALETEDLLSQQGFETGWTTTAEDGTFTFLGVPPGEYRVTSRMATNAWAPLPGTPGFSVLQLTPLAAGSFRPSTRPATEPLLWADAHVPVADRDVADVMLSLQPGFRLSGRFEFDGKSDLPTPQKMQNMFVQLRPVDSARQPVSMVAPSDGTFTTAPYAPGRFEIVARHPDSTWRVSSIRVGGREAYDKALELDGRDVTDAVVVLTDRKTILSGSVSLSSTEADSSVMVVVFPADVESWIADGMIARVSWSVPASRTGAFTIGNMRPGDYLVASVSSDRQINLQDPSFVRAVARRASRVSVRSGDNLAPVLRTIEIR